MGLSTSAKIAAAPGQKPSSRLRSWLASWTRVATRSSRPRTSARRARVASEGGGQRAEAMTVGAQQIGEQIGVAAVVLGAGGAVARARGLHRVGVNGHDRVARRDQRVHDQPRGPLHGDGQVAGRAAAGEPARHLAQASRIVARLEAVDDRAAVSLDDADGVNRPAPVQSDRESHGTIPPFGVALAPAGRTCEKLIVRRSRNQPTAHQPVARLVLPAPAARRVSRGPSRGERRRPSRQDAGSGRLTPTGATLPRERVVQ